MKKRTLLFVCAVLVAIMALGAASASDTESGQLYILPDVYPIGPDAEPQPCEHEFGTATNLDTVSVDLDEYYHCYMEIDINAKTCENCGVTAYDLDYRLFPHEGNEMFCKRCGKHLVPPVVAAPLGE